MGPNIREVLQNEFRYDFRKGPQLAAAREISAGTVITGLKAIIMIMKAITCIMHVNNFKVK